MGCKVRIELLQSSEGMFLQNEQAGGHGHLPPPGSQGEEGGIEGGDERRGKGEQAG